jgi:hypothetical protein
VSVLLGIYSRRPGCELLVHLPESGVRTRLRTRFLKCYHSKEGGQKNLGHTHNNSSCRKAESTLLINRRRLPSYGGIVAIIILVSSTI